MQHSNDTSKNSTRPPYLVKNERSLRRGRLSSCLRECTTFDNDHINVCFTGFSLHVMGTLEQSDVSG